MTIIALSWNWIRCPTKDDDPHLGLTLFNLSTRKTGLTSEGRIFYAHVVDMLRNAEAGHEPIKPNDVRVVDEAGIVSTRQMDRIMQKVTEIGAKLVLIGDPDQLPPLRQENPSATSLTATAPPG